MEDTMNKTSPKFLSGVQRFSRDCDLCTLTAYDDNRTDPDGEVAALVAGAA